MHAAFFQRLSSSPSLFVFDSSHSRLVLYDHRYQHQQHYSTMSGVPPTRMNQQIFKGKKKAAEGGHRLLKKKADALKVRWSSIIESISATMGISLLDDVNFNRTRLAFS
jgi:hypothetical protein